MGFLGCVGLQMGFAEFWAFGNEGLAYVLVREYIGGSSPNRYFLHKTLVTISPVEQSLHGSYGHNLLLPVSILEVVFRVCF